MRYIIQATAFISYFCCLLMPVFGQTIRLKEAKVLDLEVAGQKALHYEAERLVQKEDKIEGANGRLSIYLGETDSLYHPHIDLKYDSTHKVFAFKVNPQFEGTRWLNHHHEMYIEADFGEYILARDSLSFSSSDRTVSLISYDYFELSEYEALIAKFSHNPFEALSRYAKQIAKDSFTVAQFIAQAPEANDWKKALKALATKGYITLDAAEKRLLPF